jgi:flagellar M-ring protein FliF
MALTQIGAAAFVVLALGLFVLRPILLAAKSAERPLNEILPADLLEGPQPVPALTKEPSNDLAPRAASRDLAQTDTKTLSAPKPSEDPVERLKALIEERQDETVEVLKSWIEAPEVTIQ